MVITYLGKWQLNKLQGGSIRILTCGWIEQYGQIKDLPVFLNGMIFYCYDSMSFYDDDWHGMIRDR